MSSRSGRSLWNDDGWLQVTPAVAIPPSELTIRATRAGGPGGQHVNTSSTRIEVTWNVRQSVALDDVQRARLEARLASKLDQSGTLRVVSAESRSQAQNRERALARLAELVRGGLTVPKTRRETKPTFASRKRRLETKKRQGEKKRERKWRDRDG